MSYYLALRPDIPEFAGTDLHITMGYLGSEKRLDSLAEEYGYSSGQLLLQLLRYKLTQLDALELGQLALHVQGYGHWLAGDRYYGVALVGGWEPHVLRNLIHMRLRGLPPSLIKEDFPFLPHITLESGTEPPSIRTLKQHIPFTVDQLYLSNGAQHETVARFVR